MAVSLIYYSNVGNNMIVMEKGKIDLRWRGNNSIINIFDRYERQLIRGQQKSQRTLSHHSRTLRRSSRSQP